ncbi:uncharacterized protein LOC143146204 [Ptiloglossa arizonensis]|uniref:uncharacterized protein LOC143146204 n=1 Tax=Ptiloglossa arizonensis TaxID=3350558 RepID=UPI003F9EC298
MVVGEGNVRKIHGDGLSLMLPLNEQILEITGDGCSVTVAKNCGSVRVIGDGCRLRIDLNLGDVEYTGDGGRVLLGPKSSRSKVRYVGDGGKVTSDGEKKTKNRKVERSSKITDETRAKDADANKKNSGEKTKNPPNERREQKGSDRGKKQEKVVKIVARSNCDEQVVTRWFVNPGTVIKSFDGATFVKIGSAERKIKVK